MRAENGRICWTYGPTEKDADFWSGIYSHLKSGADPEGGWRRELGRERRSSPSWDAEDVKESGEWGESFLPPQQTKESGGAIAPIAPFCICPCLEVANFNDIKTIIIFFFFVVFSCFLLFFVDSLGLIIFINCDPFGKYSNKNALIFSVTHFNTFVYLLVSYFLTTSISVSCYSLSRWCTNIDNWRRAFCMLGVAWTRAFLTV